METRRLDLPSPCYGVAFSPLCTSPTLLAAGLLDHTIALCDPVSCNILHTLKGHTYTVRSVAFSPCGRLLASASIGNPIKLWDLQTMECVASFSGNNIYADRLVFSPDGSLIGSNGFAHIELWDIHTKSVKHVLKGHSLNITDLAFAPSGRVLASASLDSSLRLWKISDSEANCVMIMKHPFLMFPRSLAFSKNNMLACGSDDVIMMWELHEDGSKTSLRNLGILFWHDNIRALTFTPSGRHLVCGSVNRGIKVWDVVVLGQVKIFEPERQSAIENIAFHPNGLEFATSSNSEGGGVNFYLL